MKWGRLALAAILALQDAASACTTCFGAAGDQATQGLNMAILTLLGVMSSVVLAASVCIGVIVYRAGQSEAEEQTTDSPRALQAEGAESC